MGQNLSLPKCKPPFQWRQASPGVHSVAGSSKDCFAWDFSIRLGRSLGFVFRIFFTPFGCEDLILVWRPFFVICEFWGLTMMGIGTWFLSKLLFGKSKLRIYGFTGVFRNKHDSDRVGGRVVHQEKSRLFLPTLGGHKGRKETMDDFAEFLSFCFGLGFHAFFAFCSFPIFFQKKRPSQEEIGGVVLPS